MLCLRVIGPETSRTMFFDKSSVNIGRIEGNDIVLPSPQVSKQHVKIIEKETLLILMDISSANGTCLNGSKVIGGVQIKINDEITIGPYKIKVLSNSLITENPQKNQSSEFHLEYRQHAEPTRSCIRQMLNYILKTDPLLDEFCIDYLPEIRQKITTAMDRTMKLNLIMENGDLRAIQSIIFRAYHAKYIEFLTLNRTDE